MQLAWAGSGASARAVTIPDSREEIVPGVAWGAPEHPNTPAYWAVRCRWDDANPDYVSPNASVAEETGFCLLGGYGIRYEVNEAAFERLKDHQVFDLDAAIAHDLILALLNEPLEIGGTLVRYRFPNQRAQRLSGMREHLRDLEIDGLDPQGMRDALQSIDGIGPKTASWIVRNLLGSDEVAIIDVHILRACTLMGVFPEDIRLPRDYAPLERRFIDFSEAMEVRPSVLDAVMWSEMRTVQAKTWTRYRNCPPVEGILFQTGALHDCVPLIAGLATSAGAATMPFREKRGIYGALLGGSRIRGGQSAPLRPRTRLAFRG